MLYIIKQIKRLFLNSLESTLFDKQQATQLANDFDVDKNEKISGKEMFAKYNELIAQNKELDAEKKKLIADIYNKHVNNKEATHGLYYISKKEFIKLLTKQTNEHKAVTVKHEKAKKAVTNETRKQTDNLSEKERAELENYVINFARNWEKLRNNKKEVIKLQKTLLALDKNALPEYGADGDFGNETVRAMDKITIKFNEKVKNSSTNTKKTEKSSGKKVEEKERVSEDYQKIILNFDIKKYRRNPRKVKELQKALIKAGYKLKGANNGVDGKFGGSTKRAYESALATYKHVENLKTVKDFTQAYSEVYGSTDKLINPKDGVLGQVLKYVTESDVQTLKNKLGFDYKKIDKKLVKEFAGELGIKEDSPEYNRYLKKTLIEAGLSTLISYLLSGGDDINALIRLTGFNPHKIAKLFGVDNIDLIYKKAPSTDKILSVLLGKKVSHKQAAKEAYIKGMKTNKEIKDVLKASLDLDIDNIRRIVRELDGYIDLSIIPFFGTTLNTIKDFMGDEFEGLVRELRKQRDGKLNVEKVDDIMGKIGYKILKPLRKAIAKGGVEAQQTKIAYNELASIIGRYTNLEQKFYKINGGLTKRAKQEIIKDQNAADKQLRELGYNVPHKNTEKLHSKLSYGFNIEKSIRKYGKEGYVKRLAETLSQDRKHSMLATVAATLTEKTTGLSFSMKDLVDAMKNIKKVNIKDIKLLSNVGVGKVQQFQGKMKGSLYVIDLNGAKVYFKGECNNPLAIVHEQSSTLLYADSQGLYKKINLHKKKNPDQPGDPVKQPGNPGSTPDIDEPVDLPTEKTPQPDM